MIFKDEKVYQSQSVPLRGIICLRWLLDWKYSINPSLLICPFTAVHTKASWYFLSFCRIQNVAVTLVSSNRHARGVSKPVCSDLKVGKLRGCRPRQRRGRVIHCSNHQGCICPTCFGSWGSCSFGELCNFVQVWSAENRSWDVLLRKFRSGDRKSRWLHLHHEDFVRDSGSITVLGMCILQDLVEVSIRRNSHIEWVNIVIFCKSSPKPTLSEFRLAGVPRVRACLQTQMARKGGFGLRREGTCKAGDCIFPCLVQCRYPLVNIQKAIENGHWNSWCSYSKWWFSIVM